jgi:hypothetical protein
MSRFGLSWSRANKALTFFSIAFGAKFGEQVLQYYMGLPLPLLVSAFLAITAAIATPAIVFMFGVKDERYRADYKLLLRKLYDYLWSFVISGLGTAYVVLAIGMAPFWMLWGTWVVLGFFGLILYEVWLMREPLNMRLVGEWVFKRFGIPLEQATDAVTS